MSDPFVVTGDMRVAARVHSVSEGVLFINARITV